MKALVEIGTKVEAVKAAKDAISEILNARADQETIRCALGALVASVQPKDITFMNCTFGGEDLEESS